MREKYKPPQQSGHILGLRDTQSQRARSPAQLGASRAGLAGIVGCTQGRQSGHLRRCRSALGAGWPLPRALVLAARSRLQVEPHGHSVVGAREDRFFFRGRLTVGPNLDVT